MQTSITLQHKPKCPNRRNNPLVLSATWEGGAYIDVGFTFSRPLNVINVWNYETGSARVPFTREGMRKAIRDWRADYAEQGQCNSCAILRDFREMAKYSY